MEEEEGKESASYEIHSRRAKICKGGLVGRLQHYGIKLESAAQNKSCGLNIMVFKAKF